MSYDSTADTVEHIHKVQNFIDYAIDILEDRAIEHDQSKLDYPEKEAFDKYTPLLKDLEYGSDEYRQTLRMMKPAIQHHNENNSHHPEHYKNGIAGMSLLDLIEMLCDWRAASERGKGGYDKHRFKESIHYNKGRFLIEDQLFSVLLNTARELGFIE